MTLNLLLNAASARTLAYLLRDLQLLQEEWAHYPEDAPDETSQTEIAQLISDIELLGPQKDENFPKLLAEIIAAQEEADWLEQRNAQERDNWLKDYQ